MKKIGERLVLLSYVNLWAARKLAINFPRPWEKYNSQKTPSKITPSIVQKDIRANYSYLWPKNEGAQTPRLFPRTSKRRKITF